MITVAPETENLARRLIAFEAAHDNSSDAPAESAVQVIDELRAHLIKLTGVEGFRSLLSRALTLAKASVPSLNMVHVDADGMLKGFDGSERSQEEEVGQAGLILVGNLLELLVTFIGARLTLGLVRDKWPDASTDGAELRIEEPK